MAEKDLTEELLTYQDRLYRAAVFFCRGNAEQARDLLQETMLAACQSLRRYQKRANLYTYLYRILINTYYGRLRRERKNLFIRTPPDNLLSARDNNPLEEMLAAERRESLRKAILSLPEIYQVMITLRHLEELSYQEIAEILSLPLGTVKSRLTTARQILSRILKKDRTFWVG
ncbi:MAG: sigma-70 family RNA polymerase sigma factor [Candidatus Omnitrophota bacterium]